MKRLLAVLLALMLLWTAAGCGGGNTPAEEEDPPEQPPAEETVTVEFVAPVCVVINNHQAARPQSGLQQARLVYEFLVEGGITRFLAVYDQPFAVNFIIGRYAVCAFCRNGHGTWRRSCLFRYLTPHG